MRVKNKPALPATDVPLRKMTTGLPGPFRERVEGRTKRALGDHFGLKNFGVNLTTIPPGKMSAVLHTHSKQDEFVYIVEGEPTLRTESGAQRLEPGMVAGFPAGGEAHHLVNETDAPVVYLEIGDRTPGDEGTYPEDDLKAVQEDGGWVFLHKDGTTWD